MRTIKTVAAFLVLTVCLLSFSGCGLSYTARERKHYSDKNNFVSVTAVCISSGYYSGKAKESHCYAIDFCDAEYDRTGGRKFQNVTFRIDEKSTRILEEHNFEEKLKPGTTFTCISAPIYLSNSYDCPIVALEIDGEVLLDFETGYRNLMATYGVKIP